MIGYLSDHPGAIMQRCLGVDGAGHNEQGLICGRLVHSRCPDCSRTVQRSTTRAKRARRPYTTAEQARRAQSVADWLAQHGPVCPGWRRPPHTVTPGDLTADHPHAVAAGGQEAQPHAVLCRSCNGSKGAQV